ncbi:MAG: PEP-CTERM sorting domain-containing protein [Hydrogenophilales bacterium 28-61-23]|nr:MAG: PEP-CTERM sorting domain-containing protein [Hydrogenophilales bacterium 28-61-23]
MAKLKLSTLAVTMSLALAPNIGSASVVGFLGNFDVINDTGSTAHGFEIELEGLHSYEITDTFGGEGRWFPSGRGYDSATSVVRYGAPSITEYTNGAIFGTKVTYFGVFDGTKWDYGTPTVPVGQFATPGDNCWSGGGLAGGYNASTPCDHFGVGTTKNATKTTYSWLHDTGAGVLTNANGVVSLPAPAWNVIPAVVPVGAPPAPPIVEAVIEAPIPENEAQFGEAIWVKVFTTELENEVELEDLIGGNPVIDNAVTEVEWQLLQYDPKHPASGVLESGYGIPVGPNAASIVRRYEFYKYSGEYKAEDHEALLVIDNSNPVESEIGTYIGAQNAAANLNVAAVPEPETYAMLLVGVGLIGLRLRQRGRSAALS